MGNNKVTTGNSAKRTFKARKATFTVKIVKGQREFTAVNKRAKIVAKKAGKKKFLKLAQLKALAGTGSYKYYAYTDQGLKAIKF